VLADFQVLFCLFAGLFWLMVEYCREQTLRQSKIKHDLTKGSGASQRSQHHERTDQVAILKVEAVQLVARLLGIHHILVHDKCGALCIARDALADLTGKGVSSASLTWYP
jgi:hypothetical protein